MRGRRSFNMVSFGQQFINNKGPVMKNLFRVLFVSLFTLVAAQAGTVPPAMNEVQKAAVVENLLAGLDSGNDGLMISSAQFLGELEDGSSVIPLMKLLHESKNDGVRIAAALSLIKIGDLRGVFAVKQAVRFDESAAVRNMCSIFYRAYLHGSV